MAITIGEKPDRDFSDPIGVLEDCHRRIELLDEVTSDEERDELFRSLTLQNAQAVVQ